MNIIHNYFKKYFRLNFLFICFIMFLQVETFSQFKNAWMSVGSVHNWYSEIGSELEEMGFVKTQQDGMQYPAYLRYQDMQAMRGMWIGAKDFTDEQGQYFSYKVINIGPRPPAFYPAYPIEFKMISKFNPTEVSVDGNLSYQKDVQIDEIDPSLIWDRMLVNTINTQLGITMTRKIFQFSQQFNDNYIIYDYTFKNTGNVDADPEIELPSQTIKDVYFYFHYRNAVNKQVRFIIGNSTGWGKNTMNDARGDGPINSSGDPANEYFRAQFSWHGYTSEKDVAYDNIGGPIWQISSDAKPFVSSDDTVGRLAGTQFLGLLTLHADKSATDKSDDFNQPSTTTYENSDDPLYLAGANAYNVDLMTRQYSLISKGHMSPRHAKLVEPSGDYAIQKANPNGNNSGGYNFNNGYGPFTIGPGEEIHIIMVEAAAGMNYDEQVRIGKLFKTGAVTAEQKNREVMKSRDSLFQTFRRAIANYESGWNIPSPPFPPSTFDVTSGGDKISLSWTLNPDDPNPPEKIKIYRALGDYDKPYEMITEVNASVNSYDDKEVIRGFNYFYYITAVGPEQPGGPGTPAGRLESGRYYTQTYDPANLLRQAGQTLSQIRIVPNPYIVNAQGNVRFPGVIDQDKIAFYNIPGNCTIKIYSELGELIKIIEHTNGSGDENWYNVTSSNQIVVSGIYIAVIIDNDTGEKHIEKFAVIR